jgi:hypothetical protein
MTRTHRLAFAAHAVLLIACSAEPASVHAGESSLVSAVIDEADPLRQLVAAVESDEPESASYLSHILDTPTDADALQAVRYLVWVGRRDANAQPNSIRSRWIQRPLIVKLLSSGLRDSHEPTRRIVVRELMTRVRPGDLRAIVPAVIEAHAEGHVGVGAIEILALANTPDAQRYVKRYGASRALSDRVRARLADESSLERIAVSFGNASTAGEKSAYAADLGFVGGRQAATLLAAELRTPLVGGRKHRRSARYDILRALGRVYPDEDLFDHALSDVWSSLRELATRAERQRATDAYLHLAEAWCNDELGTKWEVPRARVPLYDFEHAGDGAVRAELRDTYNMLRGRTESDDDE